MRIRELHLSHFRSFNNGIDEPKVIEFSNSVTIIAGINGHGKTSILDAIAILVSRLLPLISPARSGYKNIVKSDVHYEATTASLKGKFHCAGIPIDFEMSYDWAEEQREATSLTRPLRDTVRRAYGDPTREDDQAPLVVYYTTDRAGYRFPKSLPRVAANAQSMAYNGALFNRTVDYKDFIARYRVLSAHAEEELRESRRENTNEIENVVGGTFGQNVIDAINQTLSSFLEGFSNLRVDVSPVRLVIDKDGATLDIRQLSDGERSFIAMICDLGRRLALANPDLDNPLLGAGVVLIDEVELHLHPKWQLDVVEKLRNTFPNIQFIITTHSPFIIQTARQGEVVLLDHDLVVDPHGKSLEAISKYVMDVQNTDYSPRIQSMHEVAREYLRLAEEAKGANAERRQEIQQELIRMLAPFSDNPAYVALLESKGLV